MLFYIGDFDTSIKAQVRKVDVLLAFKKADDTFFYLTGDDLQEVNYTSQVEKELGGVVKKVVNAKLMYTELTSFIKEGDFFNLFYTTGETGKCKADIFYINRLRTDSKKQVISIEAVDLLSYMKDNIIPFIPMMKNTNLKTYMIAVFNSLGLGYLIGDVANPNLTLGYPKSRGFMNTLTEMAIASQGLICCKAIDVYGCKIPAVVPFSFNQPIFSDIAKVDVRPFKIAEPCDYPTYDDLIMDVEKDSDNTDKYDRVVISLFFPSSSQQKSLGKLNVTLPASTPNYNIGTVEFGQTKIPQVCHFDKKIKIADYSLGSDKCTLILDNESLLAENVNLEFFGLDVNEATLSGTATDSNCKNVTNLYIQSPTVYDHRIYLNPSCRIKYRGNPLYEVGDTIDIDGDRILILEHILNFNGALKGTMKGVVING